MTSEQIKLVKDVCLTDDGTGNPKAGVFTVLFNDEISFRNTDDFVIWDDANELIHKITINFDGPVSGAAWPYKISTGFFGNIQFLEGLYNMTNFEKVIDEMFVNTGLIDQSKKEMIMKWAENIRNHAMVPMHPGPYYPSVPHIPPKPPVPECRPDGIFHGDPIDQRTKKNMIFKVVDAMITAIQDPVFEKVRPAYYKVTTLDVTAFAEQIKGFIEGMGKDLFYASYTDNDVAAIYNPKDQDSIDNFVQNAVDLVLPAKKKTSKNTILYIEAYGVRVRYDFCVTYENDDEADAEWVANTTESIVNFVEQINNPAIDSVIINDDYSYSAVINTTDGLDIGLTEFLASLPDTSKVVYSANGQSYTLTVGDEESYETFKKGVISTMPNSNNAAPVTGTATVTSTNDVELQYTLKVKYFNEAEAVAKIGAKYYSVLANAFADAKSGDTIELLQDVDVSNDAVEGTSNTPIYVIHDGVTFNGGTHTMTAKSDGWVSKGGSYGDNHILGVTTGTATIQNLNLVGHSAMKSGIVVWKGASATIDTVDIKNCGNCGVQAAGGTVVLSNYTSSGNVWGSVNADMGDDVAPSVTFNSGTMSEKVEIYTEITDQDVVTAPTLTKYQGFGTQLKGFIYYTSDVSRLGNIFSADDTVVYETLEDAAKNGTSIKLTKNLTGITNIPVGKSIEIDGQGATINGQIKCIATGTGATNVTLKNMTLDGAGSGVTYGIISQNQTDEGQMECNLTLNNVNMTGYTSKAIYGTNLKTLTINGGTISDCATGEMDDPNTKGDYAIDLNLCAVQGTVVMIDGVTFSGDLGQKAAIKITQRGGASDEGASDIPKNVGEASIESVTIQNCNFTGSTTEVDFRIGTDNKTPDGDGLNTTGAFAVTLTGNTEMVVQSAYLENEPTLTVPQGRSASKTAESDIALDETPSEQIDEQVQSFIEGLSAEGVTVEADPSVPNTYSITTNGSMAVDSLIDQIVALEGVTGLKITDGSDTAEYMPIGGDLATFKSQVAAMLPTLNEDPEVTLTMTVTVG